MTESSSQPSDIVKELEGAQKVAQSLGVRGVPRERNIEERGTIFPQFQNGQQINFYSESAHVRFQGRWHDGDGRLVALSGNPNKPAHDGAPHMALCFTITVTTNTGVVVSHGNYIVTGDYTAFFLPQIPDHAVIIRLWANDHPGQFADNDFDPANPTVYIVRRS